MTSRQSDYQARRIAAGRCGTCGKRALSKSSKVRCEVCIEVARRVARARSGSKPWRKGSRGRPPKVAKP